MSGRTFKCCRCCAGTCKKAHHFPCPQHQSWKDKRDD